ncbi:arsenate reductase [Oxalicibacterium flavum]|uniref:Arsenate reductase n=1 Tax=Oxalicibacterium flavum TaxID=179467 RepID=A0A8J2UKE2_9BURK|nr:ArsC family reductase [Oxalicibacterium flavum]GGC03154.1 arsenate reductase [Oxalicibacterium flavum]
MTITLYGIPNCDTVKKARTWLETNDIDYTFHDFKKNGITAALVAGWLQDVPRDTLINRKGTTWRKIPDEQKAAITDDASAVALMLEAPSVIKRPVLTGAGQTSVGFSADAYQQIFKK